MREATVLFMGLPRRVRRFPGALARREDPAALSRVEDLQQIGERFLCEILRSRDLAGRFIQNPLGAKIRFEIDDFTEQVGNAQPALDHGLVHLEVELKTIDAIAKAKGLILAGIAARQQRGS